MGDKEKDDKLAIGDDDDDDDKQSPFPKNMTKEQILQMRMQLAGKEEQKRSPCPRPACDPILPPNYSTMDSPLRDDNFVGVVPVKLDGDAVDESGNPLPPEDVFVDKDGPYSLMMMDVWKNFMRGAGWINIPVDPFPGVDHPVQVHILRNTNECRPFLTQAGNRLGSNTIYKFQIKRIYWKDLSHSQREMIVYRAAKTNRSIRQRAPAGQVWSIYNAPPQAWDMTGDGAWYRTSPLNRGRNG